MIRLLLRPRNLIKNIINGVNKTRSDDCYWKLYEKYKSFTMIHRNAFCSNLDLISHYGNVEGCIIECGVWKGGMLASIAEVIGPNREFHAFDSFEGLPDPTEKDGIEAKNLQENKDDPYYHDNCTAAENCIKEAMGLSGTLNFHSHKGWFKDTIPPFKEIGKPIAILRLDGDWYESTLVCLKNLVPLVVKNGLVIIDDYYTWSGCARAVNEFCASNEKTMKIRQWRDGVCYIQIT